MATNSNNFKKLKSIVSNKQDWDTFCDYLDDKIAEQHTKVENAQDIKDVWKALGAIESLKLLKRIRDNIEKAEQNA